MGRPSMSEVSLVLIKPDGVQRRLVGTIITRLEQRGLDLVGMKLMKISEELAREHYAAHVDKPFFPPLLEYINSGPVVAMVWRGKRAIEAVRQTLGATDPVKAAPGTIRADLALEIGRNLTHGSDSPEAGEQEVARFFKPEEILDWQPVDGEWVYE